MTINVIVTGAQGQLGQCLQDTINGDALELNISFLSREQLDLTREDEISSCFNKLKPDFVVNCAAYTAVDKAEKDAESAYRVNRDAVKFLTEATRKVNGKLIHISTDFVFDGKASVPYMPEASTNPIGVYGASKLEGEKAVMKTLADQSMIIRTAWVYAEHGNNFVKTMLRLMKEKPSLSVVSDQTGSPTYARGLAQIIWSIILHQKFQPDIYHWTDKGGINWYDFACAIQEEALSLDLLDQKIPIHPIPTAEYPTPAARPAYSVLDCSKLESLVGQRMTDWRKNLREMLRIFSKMSI